MAPFHIALVLGGARSGKSHHAEALAESAGSGRLLYLATAQAGDAEMAHRIALHRARRGAHWQTIEAPLDVVAVIRQAQRDDVVLLDCLTLWLSNILLAEDAVDARIDDLCAALTEAAATIVLVANEVGLGIVPVNALARHFRDEAGFLNQRVAGVADLVIFMAAGLPLVLKGPQPAR